MSNNAPIIKQLGQVPYLETWQAMRSFTDTRTDNTPDELWVLEHDAVFTQGQAGKAEHILNPGNIPVVQADRGGQVTYHGPGQLVIYTLIDLKRLKLSIRDVVTAVEQSVIALLREEGVQANARCDAPGVYVNGAKICSIGLRVRKGRTYHGLAFNVNMDLTPFSFINPCGYEGMKMAQLSDLTDIKTVDEAAAKLLPHLQSQLGYTVTAQNNEVLA